MSLRVSVVIPAFNRPVAVVRAARSALAQTCAPHEIVIVDDGSQEPVAAGEAPRLDSRVRVIAHQANRGAAQARQTGIDAATGDVVALLDSDDAWSADKLAAQIPLLQKKTASGLVAASCGWTTAPEDGAAAEIRIPRASADPVDFASGCWFSPGSTVIAPIETFRAVGPFDSSLRRLEDLDWFLRFGLAGGALRVAPMIGATISIGRRRRMEHVSAARDAILSKFSADARVNPRILRRLSAYLDLERAASAHDGGDRVGTAWYLARSFAFAPRTSLHLRDWWTDQPVRQTGDVIRPAR